MILKKGTQRNNTNYIRPFYSQKVLVEKTIFNQKIANIGINGIIRFRFFWLLLIFLVVFVCSLGLEKLHMDSSNESFLPDNDPLSLANDRFKEQFGNEEFVFILVKSENLISHKTLQRLRALQKDLEENLPFVDEVNAITSVEFIESSKDQLRVDDLVGDQIPATQEDFELIKNKLSSSKLFFNRIVASDWQHAGVAVLLEPMPDTVWVNAAKDFSPMDLAYWPDEAVLLSEDVLMEKPEAENSDSLVQIADPRKLIAPAIRVILNRHQKEDFELKATGMPLGDFEVDQVTAEEGSKIGLIAMAAAFFFILVLFRNVSGIAAPMLVMISTVIIVFGCMGWLGIPVSMGSMFVGPLLMVLSVSYSIHFINHFKFYFDRRGERLRAIHYAYAQATWPCFLTSLTTAIGFASFLIVSMKPIRDVGIACSGGSLISFLLVLLLVPIFYSFGKPTKEKPKSNQAPSANFPKGMVPLSGSVLKNRMPILILTLGFLFFGVFFIRYIPIETDLLKILGKDNKFVKDSTAITDVLGGYYSYEVMINLDKADAAKRPEVLKALDLLAKEAEKWETVKTTMSLVDLVKEINYVLNQRQEEAYIIPDSVEKIAQCLLLYEISGGGELDNWVDYQYSTLRLSVQMSNSENLGQHISHMQEKARDLFPADTQIDFVGDVPILLRLMSLLTIGQLKSILIAFLAISLVMVIILKSVKAGLISMIPNVFPLFVIGGLMGLFEINLDIMTIMIAPMIIGIAVDDTVHFFIHFKDELEGFQDYEKANKQTFVKIGHALLFTTIVLSLGFGILGFSLVDGIGNMGFLATAGIISALAADFFIAPLLLVHLKPFGRIGQPN